jgi:signal transduction histidine kinase
MVSVPILLSVQLLVAEAWRNERLINHVRTAVLSIAVLTGGAITTYVLGRPHANIILMLAWLVFIAVFNATWFKRNYHPAVPWLLSAGELTIIATGFVVSRSTVVAARPDIADRQLGLLPVAFFFFIAINMLRFSWRLSLFCGAFSALLVIGTYAYAGVLDPLLIPILVMMGALSLVVAYTTRRFENLLQRQSIDLKRIQKERIASLRSLVAGVCHELNNPLGTLLSNAQISARSLELLRSGDPAKSERALTALNKVADATEQATSRMEKIIDSLKSFARLDEAEVKSADVRTMLEDAIALLSLELERIEVVREFEEIPPVTCRPGELNQVFMHVLRNAAQADSKRIAISARKLDGGVQVMITDDGRGIAPETLQRIFDPTFSSAHGRVKLGFGLSASQGILEDHGGRIDLESAPGNGTVVRIHIRPTLPDVR